MPRILIASQQNTHPLAQKLLESLSQYYQSIGLLSDDSQVATQSIPVADMLVVVIGENWVTDIADDTVQSVAIADALRRSDLPVMAVLADGVTMPVVTELPAEHRAIAYMSAVSLHSDSESFNADVLTIARQMAGYIKETSPEGYSAQIGRAISHKKRSGVPFNIIIIGMALLLGVGIIAIPRLRGGTPNPVNAPRTTPRFNETVSARLAERDVQIGVAAGLSNESDPRGQEMLNGIQLALISRPTVLIGNNAHDVDILVQDTACTASGGISVANTFVASPDMVAVIGAECEETCSAGATIYDRGGMTVISPACTSPRLTQEDYPSFYRVVPSQAYTAVASAQVALATGWNNAIVVHDEQLIGAQLAYAFQTEYQAGGGQYTTIPIETTTFSMTQLVANIIEQQPNVVYFAGRETTLLELRASLPADMPLIGGIFLRDMTVIPDNIVFVQLTPPVTPEIESLRQRYIAQFGANPTSLIFAYAYDATNMILDAIEQTATDNDGTIALARFDLWDVVRAYDRVGITGRIACAGERDCARLDYTATITQDGAFIPFGGE